GACWCACDGWGAARADVAAWCSGDDAAGGGSGDAAGSGSGGALGGGDGGVGVGAAGGAVAAAICCISSNDMRGNARVSPLKASGSAVSNGISAALGSGALGAAPKRSLPCV